jgi:flagellar biosynthesis protein FlhG
MADQAEMLRQRVGSSRAATGLATASADDTESAAGAPSRPRRPARPESLLFASGKGGVGTSNLVLNLAIALGELGKRVLVVDADIGLANLDLLCGLHPRYDLGDVLAGDCALADIVVNGPAGIRIVPGAHAMRRATFDLGDAPARLLAELGELESACEFVLVDGGSGLGAGLGGLAAAADQVVVVSTPEPTSIADAHAAINQLRRLHAAPRLLVLVNQAASEREAALALDSLVNASRQFLGAVVTPLGPGYLRADPHVALAVRSRRPFLTAFPGAVASKGIRRLASALLSEHDPPVLKPGARLLTALGARWARAPARLKLRKVGSVDSVAASTA